MTAISLLTIRYGMLNKRRLERYLGIGKSLTKGCKSCYQHMLIRIRISGCSIIPYPLVQMTPDFCITCFGLSVHALMNSNIASRLSVLMGPIYRVNIKESCWLQQQLMLTTRYSLLPLLLWIMSQGLVGGGFYNASEIQLANDT